ncbi:CRISPR-associated protein Cas5 [Tepidibacter thalassicus]|uniref:CRISPR-associated protein Cas5, N-terminal domain-containing protein n=1 Tax=Tepidibacter thalassicus DSM 15285 TaxID=1123350 RepID=A0A1M5PUC9_9FIRM|nr:CRISPR-associated protein Cas5 [Tepidibacter thalassicus]SHH05465.1 CRISPR-associated protein Cas5, N-terminal domain-containing protein [Tepidibacter thalassicus DSM 15285]
MSKQKVLLIDIHQPFAHYRDPKIIQDDYIPTLNLPPATTIAGMISYLIDRQLNTEFKIGVVGSYKNKVIEFIRGENRDFIGDYEKLLNKEKKRIKKNKLEQSLEYGEFYNYHKKRYGNRIMNFEILQNVDLKIFLSTENNDLVKSALEKPNKYLSLGRKEDFIIPKNKGESFVKEVEIETKFIKSKKDAIKNEYLFKNTYIPVDIKSDKSRNIIDNGVLYALPKTYKDLNAQKKDRVMKYEHYIYLDNTGAYIYDIEANIYQNQNKDGHIENIVFTWL